MFSGRKAQDLEEENQTLKADLANLTAWAEQYKVMDAVQIETANNGLRQHQSTLQISVDDLENQLSELKQSLLETSDLVLLQEIGIYEFKHRLDDAAEYKDQLAKLKANIKTLAKQDSAVSSAAEWTIGNDARAGAKMAKDISKLMLRAYNQEAENILRTLKPYSLEAAKLRLDKARNTIVKLGSVLQIAISSKYHEQRLYELDLTADFLVRQEQEKQEIRDQRERQREEEKAAREFAAEKERLEKERRHYVAALSKLPEDPNDSQRAELEQKLLDIDSSIQGVEEREANIRAGYVYVISNRGSFGEHIVKIGLTRRLEPMDRVRELGDASVPFLFDVHALIFSNDAVTLETTLHQKLEHKRVNLVNQRREFFYATPSDVRQLLEEMGGEYLLEFKELPEALEWYESGGEKRLSQLGLASAADNLQK